MFNGLDDVSVDVDAILISEIKLDLVFSVETQGISVLEEVIKEWKTLNVVTEFVVSVGNHFVDWDFQVEVVVDHIILTIGGIAANWLDN